MSSCDLRKNLPVILIVLLLPVPSLFWLPDGSVLAHGPVYPWPDSEMLFELSRGYLYAWMESSGFGGPNTEPAGVLFYLYAAVLSWVTGDTHLAQSFFLYSGYSGCLAGVYFLARTLGLGAVPSISAAVFYLLNPVIFSGMPTEALNVRLLPYHIGTPVLLALAVRVINGEGVRKNTALFAAAALFLGSPGYSSLQYFVLMLMLIAVYSAYRLIRGAGVGRSGTAYRTALVFLVFLVMNAYWLGLFIYDLKGAYASRSEPGYADADLFRGFGLDLLQGFMMLPNSELASSFPWVSEYYGTSVLLVLFFFISIAGYAFISCEGRGKAVFPGILFTVSLFLAKGAKNPFDSLGEAIFLSHPYMARLFRNPFYFELVVILAFALLLGIGIGEILKRSRSISFRAAVATVIALVASGLVYGKVFILGNAVSAGERAISSQYNYIPDYYRELNAFLRADGNLSRIAAVPTFARQDWFVAYGWDKKFLGGQFLNLWSGKPLIRPIYPGSNGVNPLFDSAMHPELDSISPESWLWLMRVSGVEYITLHNDTDTELLSAFDEKLNGIEGVHKFIRNSPYLEKAGVFGRIELYRLKQELQLPRVYAASGFDLVDAGFEKSIPLLSVIHAEERPVLVFSGQQAGSVREKLEASGRARAILSPSPADGLAVGKTYGPLSSGERQGAFRAYTVFKGVGKGQAGLLFSDQNPGTYKKMLIPAGDDGASLSAFIKPKDKVFAFRDDYTAGFNQSGALEGFKAAGRKPLSLFAVDKGSSGPKPDTHYRAVQSGQEISVINHSGEAVIADLGFTLMPYRDAKEIRVFMNGSPLKPAPGKDRSGSVPFDMDLEGVLLFPGENELKVFVKEEKREEGGPPFFGLSRLLRQSIHEKGPGLPRESLTRADGVSISSGGIELVSDSPCSTGYRTSFVRSLDGIDLGFFPVFLMEYSGDAAFGQGMEASFMIDTDRDGRADISVNKTLSPPSAGKTVSFKTDLRELIQAYLPGQRDGYLVGAGLISYCDYDEWHGGEETVFSYRLLSMGMSSQGWERGAGQPAGEMPSITVDGREVLLRMTGTEGGLLAKADLPVGKGLHSLEVFEKGGQGVYSVTLNRSKIAPEQSPGLRFERINPSRYIARVSGAEKGFVLAFQEAFHPGWRAYTAPVDHPESESILLGWLRSPGRRELETHFIANGYANGWLVPDEAARKGEFKIIIEYTPQSAMEAGQLASVIGLGSVLAFAIFGRRRKG